MDVSKEVAEIIRKVIGKLENVDDKSNAVEEAVGILTGLIGYGEKDASESMAEGELRSAMGQLAIIEAETEKGAEDEDLMTELKTLIKTLIAFLRNQGYDYKYPAFVPPSGYGDPTYYAPYSGSARESRKKRVKHPSSQAKNRRLVESVPLREAVPEGEGLEWKVVLIEAGVSDNRRFYSEDVLKEAVPLFDGLASYTDHPNGGSERSVRDLAGWITNAEFDEDIGEKGAVVGIYHALRSGPIAGLLQECYERGRKDLVQFSILGEGPQRITRSEEHGPIYEVQTIEALFSLDAVAEGAAGGRVLDLMESVREEAKELARLDEISVAELAEVRPDLVEALQGETEEGKEIRENRDEGPGGDAGDAPQPSDDGGEELSEREGRFAKELRQMREELAMANRSNLLDKRLDEAKVPEPVKARIREDFEGRVFDEKELDEAIEREKGVWNDILREKPRPKDLKATASKRGRLADAVYGMLIGEDYDGVPKFRSVHEAYCKVTGLPMDTSRRVIADGLINESIGWDPLSRERLKESPSISWTNVFGTAMTRKLAKDYQIPAFNEWEMVVSDVGDLSNLKQQKVERVGYYGTLPDVDKGGTYQPLSSPGEKEATYSPSKKGGLEDWTWEDALNDDLGALRKIPKRLALAAKITLYQYVFDFLRTGHSDTVTYDGNALFSAAHGNKGTNALGSANLETAKVSMRDQTALGSSATYLAIRPEYLVVPNELEALARQLRNSEGDLSATNAAGKANPHKGTFEIIVVDYFTDANRWFLVADPNLVPTIEVGFLDGNDEPELLTMAENTGSAFTADKVLFKIRFVFGATVVDHRGFYASDSDW